MIAPPALNQYASVLAGYPVTVACSSDSYFRSLGDGTVGVRGYTLWFGDDPSDPTYVPVIYLPTSTCKRLVAIITPPHLSPAQTRNRKIPRRIGSVVSPGHVAPDVTQNDITDDGYALETILHEATHLRENSTDEARVECDTHLNAWQAVKPLGLPGWRAEATLEAMAEAHETSEVSPVDYLAIC